MRILFINNAGAGFADHVEVEPGTTVNKFLENRVSDYRAADYMIRVNRQIATADQVIVEGDRISCTARKIEGAVRYTRVVVTHVRIA